MSGDYLEHVRAPRWAERAIKNAQHAHKIPRPPASVLDLGSGDGLTTILFAHAGYDAHGIEINDELIGKSRENAQAAPTRGTVKFANGNYLPPDIRAKLQPRPHLLLTDAPDPYYALQKQPEEFDIFFIFPWPGQMDSVFEFFRQKAKPGAALLAIGGEEDWDYHGDPGVNHEGTKSLGTDKRYTVYKK
jgi:SAM-dependent methyltransferase